MSKREFHPENTETSFWVRDSENLADIIERAKDKWGNDIDLSKITLTPHYIQERGFGYDLYDSSDYGNYIEVSFNQ